MILKIEADDAAGFDAPSRPAVHILTRKGETRRIPLADILAGKLWGV